MSEGKVGSGWMISMGYVGILGRLLRDPIDGGFLSVEPRHVAVFVDGLSVLIHFALFKLHGFFTDYALWTPLA
jgi:hypothetical protein